MKFAFLWLHLAFLLLSIIGGLYADTTSVSCDADASLTISDIQVNFDPSTRILTITGQATAAEAIDGGYVHLAMSISNVQWWNVDLPLCEFAQSSKCPIP